MSVTEEAASVSPDESIERAQAKSTSKRSYQAHFRV